MASPQKGCISRLQKEYKSLLKDPVPYVQAHPVPSNLLEWHYVLQGAPGTDIAGGVYHGKVLFPPSYPFKPPSITMVTPNGRFATNTKLCLSMTDYHPETWNPMWSVGTILTGLLSFMYDSQATTGSITSTKAEKERLARESLSYNVRNPTFRKLFPEWVEEHARRQAAATAAAAAAAHQQQPHQQQQPGAAPPGEATAAAAGQATAAAGGDGTVDQAVNHHPAEHGTSCFTMAVVVLVLAVAMVPVFSTAHNFNLQGLLDRLRDVAAMHGSL